MKSLWDNVKIAVSQILAFAIISNSANAAPQDFRLRGAASCGDLVLHLSKKDNDTNSRIQADYAFEWIWGFLAAYNGRGGFDSTGVPRDVQYVEPPDEATVELFLDEYCHRRPTASVSNAADALIRELGGKIYIPKPFQ